MSQKKTGNEKLLVKEPRVGNKKAFAKLFDCYKDVVFAYSISMLKVQVLAEEIVQDVFLKIWQNREGLNPDLSFKSYCFYNYA